MFFMCPSSFPTNTLISSKEVKAFVGITWSPDQSWDQSPEHLPCWLRGYLLVMLPDLFFLRSLHLNLVAWKNCSGYHSWKKQLTAV